MTDVTAAILPGAADRAMMQGVIDMHLHTMPCLFDRPLDDIEAAQQARAAGYCGLVLKSIYSRNADRMELVRKIVPGIDLFGSIVLNHGVGGLKPEAALIMPDAETCNRAAVEQNAGTMQADGTVLPMGHREWPALLRLLDAHEAGWRD